MPRTCIRFFALLLLLLVAVPALQAAPLLQEGKKTLYQRVVSHPGAMPLKEARDGAPAAREALVPFTVLYVYARQGDWLQVGLDTRAPLGWLKKDQATDWNQSLTLLFTPRTGRDPVLFFKTEKDLKGLCEARQPCGGRSRRQGYGRPAHPGFGTGGAERGRGPEALLPHAHPWHEPGL